MVLLLTAFVMTRPASAADYAFKLVVTELKCEKMTEHEAGSEDEIQFALTAGRTLFKNTKEFNIKEGETKKMDANLWDAAIADGQELIVMFHCRETDFIKIKPHPGTILAGSIGEEDNVGDILLHVKRKGDSFEAFWDPKPGSGVTWERDNVFRMTGAGSSYFVTIEPRALVQGTWVVIPIMER
jgi:hypothetical protein